MAAAAAGAVAAGGGGRSTLLAEGEGERHVCRVGVVLLCGGACKAEAAGRGARRVVWWRFEYRNRVIKMNSRELQ